MTRPASLQRRGSGRPTGVRATWGAGRQRLIEASVEVFGERGYASATVEEICRRANTVPNSLYYHFKSKERLLAAAIDHLGTALIEEIRGDVMEAAGIHPKLERLFERWKQLLRARPQFLRFLLSIQLEHGSSATDLGQSVRALLQKMRNALVEGIEREVGPQPDLEFVAQTMISLFEGAVLRIEFEGSASDVDVLFDDMRRTIELVLTDRIVRGGSQRRPPA